MRSHLVRTLSLTACAAVSAALLATAPSGLAAQAAAQGGPSEPTDVVVDVAPGQPAIRVTWQPPADAAPPPTSYVVTVGSTEVTLPATARSYVSDDLTVGRTYDVTVRADSPTGTGDEAGEQQQLYIAPVTTTQSANPSNPLAGTDWGVYLGGADPAMIGWSQLGQDDRDLLAPIAMSAKAKYFGRWIADGQAQAKTEEYIRNSQDGDPSKLTIMTLFRMFPWEGQARIDKRLPTKAEQAAYKKFVTGMARGIGSAKTAVVVQPDGYFVKTAYDAWHKKVGRKKALLPARMLTWTSKTLAALPHTTVYVDMGSEDWARGHVAPVAKFLKLSGVKYARGFSLNVSHKNYMDREILFAKKVATALAGMGIKGKHAVLDTSDNGQPFHGNEINPPGSHHYTAPGDIGPCKTKDQKSPCTALGIPPTTDVDNPAWGLSSKVGSAAAKYVDAYLWVSRPWLPEQGAGGGKFSPKIAKLLMKTWEYSPFFSGTP